MFVFRLTSFSSSVRKYVCLNFVTFLFSFFELSNCRFEVSFSLKSITGYQKKSDLWLKKLFQHNSWFLRLHDLLISCNAFSNLLISETITIFTCFVCFKSLLLSTYNPAFINSVEFFEQLHCRSTLLGICTWRKTDVFHLRLSYRLNNPHFAIVYGSVPPVTIPPGISPGSCHFFVSWRSTPHPRARRKRQFPTPGTRNKA